MTASKPQTARSWTVAFLYGFAALGTGPGGAKADAPTAEAVLTFTINNVRPVELLDLTQ